MKRAISVALAFCYSATQVVFASSVESNFWADRKRQLAAVPLPVVRPELANLSASKKEYSHLSVSLKSLAESIPSSAGSIQDIYDSANRSNPPVLLVQDIHLNPEAQTNIASLLQELLGRKQVGLIGVEGAFNAFDFSELRSTPDRKKTAELAKSLLEQNKLGAPSLVGITSAVEPPPFVGVDDVTHYEANVRAYLDGQDAKATAQKEIIALKQTLLEQKQKYFSKELRAFDDLRAAYHRGDVGFGAYVKKLDAVAPSMDLGVRRFLEAYTLESKLDFNLVDRQRTAVLEKLMKKLSAAEAQSLMSESLSYRLGRVTFGAYYADLRRLCERKGISLKNTPAFDDYIRYVLLSDGIKADALFASVRQMEQTATRTLAKTEKELEVAQFSAHVSLLDKLVDFSLTSQEWDDFRRGGPPCPPDSTIPDVSADSGRRGGRPLRPFERFYEEADVRSAKMVENLQKHSANSAAVLITGGFHTSEIKDLLKKQKTSYIVVSPKITKVDTASGSAYLSVFAREKTPLDKVFSGFKLFVSPGRTAVASGRSYRPAPSAPLTNAEMRTALETEKELNPETVQRVLFSSILIESIGLRLAVYFVGQSIGLDWYSVMIIAILFSLFHRDNYESKEVFLGRFAQRVVGGIVLTALIIFFPGSAWSEIIHFGVNGLWLVGVINGWRIIKRFDLRPWIQIVFDDYSADETALLDGLNSTVTNASLLSEAQRSIVTAMGYALSEELTHLSPKLLDELRSGDYFQALDAIRLCLRIDSERRIVDTLFAAGFRFQQGQFILTEERVQSVLHPLNVFQRPADRYFSAAPTSEPTLSVSVEKTPVHRLLETLGLNDPAVLSKIKAGSPIQHAGLSVQTIDLSLAKNQDGLKFLSKELVRGGVTKFELVSDEQGHLIGVIPVLHGPWIHNFFVEAQPHYLDLTPFYQDVSVGADKVLSPEHWKRFSQWSSRNSVRLWNYICSKPELVNKLKPLSEGIRPLWNDEARRKDKTHTPYVYVELNSAGDDLLIREIFPHNVSAVAPASSRVSTVIPLLPTVFSPGPENIQVLDLPYHRAILNWTKTFKSLKNRSWEEPFDILVMGGGSGIDTWLVHQAWRVAQRRADIPPGIKPRIRVRDLNPLAVENVRMMAQNAGIDLVAEVGGIPNDGIYDLVVWNMPSYNPNGAYVSDQSNSHVWHDADSGHVLSEFSKRLPSLLKKEGQGIFWNNAVYADKPGGVDIVAESFRTAGKYLEDKSLDAVMSVRTELTKVPSIRGYSPITVYWMAALADDSNGGLLRRAWEEIKDRPGYEKYKNSYPAYTRDAWYLENVRLYKRFGHWALLGAYAITMGEGGLVGTFLLANTLLWAWFAFEHVKDRAPPANIIAAVVIALGNTVIPAFAAFVLSYAEGLPPVVSLVLVSGLSVWSGFKVHRRVNNLGSADSPLEDSPLLLDSEQIAALHQNETSPALIQSLWDRLGISYSDEFTRIVAPAVTELVKNAVTAALQDGESVAQAMRRVTVAVWRNLDGTATFSVENPGDIARSFDREKIEELIFTLETMAYFQSRSPKELVFSPEYRPRVERLLDIMGLSDEAKSEILAKGVDLTGSSRLETDRNHIRNVLIPFLRQLETRPPTQKDLESLLSFQLVSGQLPNFINAHFSVADGTRMAPNFPLRFGLGYGNVAQTAAYRRWKLGFTSEHGHVVVRLAIPAGEEDARERNKLVAEQLAAWYRALTRDDIGRLNLELRKYFWDHPQLIMINPKSKNYESLLLEAWGDVAGKGIETEEEDLLGETVGGFKVTGIINSGGFGTVYSAKAPNGESVALKVAAVENGNSFGLQIIGRIGSLLLETELLSAMTKGNVKEENALFPWPVSSGFDSAHRVNYLVIPLFQGKDLEARFEESGFGLNHILLMAKALQQVHGLNVMHRDVKLANFMEKTPDSLAAIDFGIAVPDGVDPQQLWPSDPMSTQGYRIPDPSHLRSPPIDLYSLGVILGRWRVNFTASLDRDAYAKFEKILVAVDRLQDRAMNPDPKNPFTMDMFVADMQAIVADAMSVNRTDLLAKPATAQPLNPLSSFLPVPLILAMVSLASLLDGNAFSHFGLLLQIGSVSISILFQAVHEVLASWSLLPVVFSSLGGLGAIVYFIPGVLLGSVHIAPTNLAARAPPAANVPRLSSEQVRSIYYEGENFVRSLRPLFIENGAPDDLNDREFMAAIGYSLQELVKNAVDALVAQGTTEDAAFEKIDVRFAENGDIWTLSVSNPGELTVDAFNPQVLDNLISTLEAILYVRAHSFSAGTQGYDEKVSKLLDILKIPGIEPSSVVLDWETEDAIHPEEIETVVLPFLREVRVRGPTPQDLLKLIKLPMVSSNVPKLINTYFRRDNGRRLDPTIGMTFGAGISFVLQLAAEKKFKFDISSAEGRTSAVLILPKAQKTKFDESEKPATPRNTPKSRVQEDLETWLLGSAAGIRPLSDEDIRDMNSELRAYPGLSEYFPSADIGVDRQKILALWLTLSDKAVSPRPIELSGQRIGDFVVEGPLKSGGLGSVYRVRHVRKGRVAAMKIANPNIDDLRGIDVIKCLGVLMLERANLQALADAADKKDLAADKRVFPAPLGQGFYDGANVNYFVMSYIDGDDLETLYQSEGLTLSDVAAMLRALQQIHELGYAHRDVKPANFVKDRGGEIHIIDFGTSILMANPNERWPNDFMGTLKYVHSALIGSHQETSDLYAIAVILVDWIPTFFASLPEQVKPLFAEELRKLEVIQRRGMEPDPSNKLTLKEVQDAVDELISIGEGISSRFMDTHKVMLPRTQIIDPTPPIDMPAYELMVVLGLNDPGLLSSLRVGSPRQQGDLTIRRISLPDSATAANLYMALHELSSGAAEFDLVYAPDGYLIGIVPVIDPSANDGKRIHHYYDFTPYYVVMGAESPEDVEESIRTSSDYSELLHSITDAGPYVALWSLSGAGRSPGAPFFEVTVGDRVSAVGVNVAALPGFLDHKQNGSAHITLPLFPTVISPVIVMGQDRYYHRAVSRWVESFENLNNRSWDEPFHVLVMGGGSGIDTWIIHEAWRRARQAGVIPKNAKLKILVRDLNPFAVANVRAMARVADINSEIRAEVGGIPSEGQFDLIAWNMPSYQSRNGRAAGNSGLIDIQDFESGHVLSEFSARLPSLLKKGGLGIFWNNGVQVNVGENRVSVVEQMFRTAGHLAFIGFGFDWVAALAGIGLVIFVAWRHLNSARDHERAEMRRGAVWLAEIGTALFDKRLESTLGKPKPFDVADLDRPAFDNDAEMAVRLNQWALDPYFQHQLFAAMKKRMPGMNPQEIDETAAMLTAVILAGDKTGAEKTTLFYFDFETGGAEADFANTVRIMTALMKMKGSRQIIWANPAFRPQVYSAIAVLGRFNLMDIRPEQVNFSAPDAMTVATLSSAAQVVLPKAMKDRLSLNGPGVFTLEDLVPPVDTLNINNLGRFLRRVLTAA